MKTWAVLCLAVLAVWPVAAPAQNTHTLPLVRPADFASQESLVRIVNRSDTSGTVQVNAIDDDGDRFGPVTLTLGARQALNITSSDWERGNAAKGLPVGIGDGRGSWRLELTTELTIDALAYIRTPDKFLTSMHDAAPVSGGSHWVPFFNPGSNKTKVSHLRIINPGATAAEVTVTGRDDAGDEASGTVRLTLPPGAARTLAAQALEEGGEGFDGSLGDGAGKWRLSVSSNAEIEVMSLLATQSGHLANLSTVPPPEPPEPEPNVCPEDEAEFRRLWAAGGGLLVWRGVSPPELAGETESYRLVTDPFGWLRWRRPSDGGVGIFTYRRTGQTTAAWRQYVDGPPGHGGNGCDGVMTCTSKTAGGLRERCTDEPGEIVIDWRIGG